MSATVEKSSKQREVLHLLKQVQDGRGDKATTLKSKSKAKAAGWIAYATLQIHGQGGFAGDESGGAVVGEVEPKPTGVMTKMRLWN